MGVASHMLDALGEVGGFIIAVGEQKHPKNNYRSMKKKCQKGQQNDIPVIVLVE